MAELEQLQALTLQVQQLTFAMMDMDKRHVQEIQQRDLQLAEMRGTLTALNTRGSRMGPGRSELLETKILHKVQPFDGHRTSWKTFEFQWRAYLIAQDRKYRELLEKIDELAKDVRNGDLDLENQELSMQLYFALVLVMPRESVRELIVRNVKQGEGAVAWRQMLGEYASTGPGNVLADGLRKSVRHHQERHPHEGTDKRSRAAEARVPQQYTPQWEEVVSALTAERAVHEPMRDDPMEIGAIGKSGKKGTGKKGKGKNDQKGLGKGPGQAKGSGTQNPNADRECFYCHRKGHVKEECRIRMADERDSKNKDEKDKRKDKRFRQKEKKRMNALEGRGQGIPGKEQQQHQSRRGSGHSRRVASTHDLCTQSNARFDDQFQYSERTDATCTASECFDAGLRCSGECRVSKSMRCTTTLDPATSRASKVSVAKTSRGMAMWN